MIYGVTNNLKVLGIYCNKYNTKQANLGNLLRWGGWGFVPHSSWYSQISVVLRGFVFELYCCNKGCTEFDISFQNSI